MIIFDSKKNLLIVSLAVAAMAVSFFIHIGPAAKLGLYEHVRKADGYIAEKKYKKALSCLHKAFETSPESKSIGTELVNGYLAWARHLNSEGDVDLAIEKMTIAYELMPSSLTVMNDLAYYLSSRAVERSFEGSAILAKEDLDIAIILAAESGKIRTNIANYFFNRAIDARDRKDQDTLFLCLETSYDLRPRFETITFLGLSFYDCGELEDAIFYWDKALALRPDDLDVQRNIERAEKEMLLEDSGETLSTMDFEVVIYREDGGDSGYLEEQLLDVYNTVGSDLEYYPPPGTRIFVYDENNFRDIFKKDGIIRGFYDGNVRIALGEDLAETFTTGVVAHEYTHAVLSAITENRCPVWLHEGIAVYEQSRYIDIGTENVEEVLAGGGRLSLSEIEGCFGDLRNRKALATAYEAAYMAVLFMLDEWGWQGLRDLLQGIKEEGHYANAIDEMFYISVSTFEDMWNNFAKDQLLPEPSPSS